MADGRVITGLSDIVVATYSNSGTTVTYTGFTKLARAVSVSVSPETTDDNNFYADNVIAETSGGVFTGGELTLTVDGLKDAASKLIFGLPTAETVDNVDVYNYGDSANAPFVGIGFVGRYMSAGVTSYVPVVFPKVKFTFTGDEFATQEDNIEWQTQELTATIFKDDTANHNWKRVAEEQTTEADAYAVLQSLLS